MEDREIASSATAGTNRHTYTHRHTDTRAHRAPAAPTRPQLSGGRSEGTGAEDNGTPGRREMIPPRPAAAGTSRERSLMSD